MKGQLLLTSLSLVATGSLMAQQRSMAEVVAIAHSYYQEMGSDISLTRGADTIELVPSSRLLSQEGTAETFYLCNAHEIGFVLVSADERMPAILGYSAHAYQPERGLPPGLLDVMAGYASMTDYAVPNRASLIMQSDCPPMLQTQWSQGDPFNRMCPNDGGYRSQVGCIATAAAQMMKYYEWPERSGTGNIDYTTYRKKIPVKLSLEDYSFSWNQMLETYRKDQFSNAQANAVAKLMYAVAASAQMDFGSDGSATTLVDCQYAMCHYFGYDQDMCLLSGSYVPSAQWDELLVNELDHSRPVLFSANVERQNVGHAFVLDGYQVKEGKVYYHVNWGWEGSGDGYYLINKLEPIDNGKDLNVGNFTDMQLVILNFQPENGSPDPIYGMVGKITFDRYYFESSTTSEVVVSFDEVLGCLPYDFTGTAQIELLNDAGTVVGRQKTLPVNIPQGMGYGSKVGVSLSGLKDGLYTVRVSLEHEDGRHMQLLSVEPAPVLQIGAQDDAIDRVIQDGSSSYVVSDLLGRKQKTAGNQGLPTGFYIIDRQKVIVR